MVITLDLIKEDEQFIYLLMQDAEESYSITFKSPREYVEFLLVKEYKTKFGA